MVYDACKSALRRTEGVESPRRLAQQPPLQDRRLPPTEDRAVALGSLTLLPCAASDDRGRAGSREGGREGARAKRRTARPACGAFPVHTIGSRDGWHMLARVAALRLDPALAALDEIPSREVLKARRRQGAP